MRACQLVWMCANDMYVHAYVYLHVYMCVCVCVCLFLCVCVCVTVFFLRAIHVCMHAYVCV